MRNKITYYMVLIALGTLLIMIGLPGMQKLF